MNASRAKTKVDLTVLIPVYNEEESLQELHDELFPVLESLNTTFEVLFVDDASIDRSPEILRMFHEQDKRVRVVRFVRNFGQQMATSAGLRYARGRAVVIMDADLQCPARYIPEFISKLHEGYDVVYGKRRKVRQPLYRHIGSRIASYLICKMTGFSIPDSASGFLALDERLVERVNRYTERSKYLSGLFAWLAYGRFAVIDVDRRERAHGKSRYRFWQLVRMVVNILTSFSTRPLKIAYWAAAPAMFFACILLLRWIYVLVNAGWNPAETTLLMALLLGFAGLQLFSLGILGEYVGRTYGEVRDQPPYVIADILDDNHDEPAQA